MPRAPKVEDTRPINVRVREILENSGDSIDDAYEISLNSHTFRRDMTTTEMRKTIELIDLISGDMRKAKRMLTSELTKRKKNG